MRKNGWKSKKNQTSVMTIAQIHEQNAKEKSAAATVTKDFISRGGSRSGRDRHEGSQPGEWQSVSAGPRSLNRPTDFSNMGRNISSGGTAPSFGPTSIFNSRKGKAGTPTNITPPMSRQPSSANMFSALNDTQENDIISAERLTSTDNGESAPQRKRLNLAPRTKPIEGEGESKDEGAGEEVHGDTVDDQSLSEEEAKAKIDLDMKELWGEKDQGGSRNPEDIADYFSALPVSHRPLLAERLLNDIFRISRLKDAEIVAKGWKIALLQQSVSADVLRQRCVLSANK